MLIEDDLEMADNISDLLELAHYNVTHAPNGKIGVELAQQNHPDLILCDVMMPDLDGYGVVHILNSDPETGTIPFIFLTAKADRNDVRHGMSLGADDYITKPFDGVDLLKVTEMRLKKNALLKATFGNNPLDATIFFNHAKEQKEFKKLHENRTIRSYKKKDILFMEGQIPNDLYYIKQGQVKTYKVNYEGKELITGIFRGGEYLGYVPLLEDKPYGERAEVLEDVKLAIIPRSDFLSLIYSSKDISNIVGTATESLNRILADFKNEGLIKASERGLKIINKAKLEKILH